MVKLPIHIVGLGNIGKLLAHSLRKYHPDIPITLLFHRQSLNEEWSRAGESIEIVRSGIADRQRGFLHEDVSRGHGYIQQLIVATKTHTTVEALKPLRCRLNSSSSLLFLQNGIGTIDEVTAQVFGGPATRPNFLAGIFNHGVYASSTFSSVHAGVADCVLGPVFSDPTSDTLHAAPLIQQIVKCSILAASAISAPELLHAQFRKLAINAVINPLTVVFDCLNGELFTNPAVCRLVDLLVLEISNVIQATLKSQPKADDAITTEFFEPELLQKVVHDVGQRTAKNSSSMRQDRHAGRQTEIDYINGYVASQAKLHDIRCPLNARIIELIRSNARLTFDQVDMLLAF